MMKKKPNMMPKKTIKMPIFLNRAPPMSSIEPLMAISSSVLVKPLLIINQAIDADSTAAATKASVADVLILLRLGEDIGQQGDYRQLGQLGWLQREQSGNDGHGTAGAIDDLAKEHHIDQAQHRDHGQSRYHGVQERGLVVVHALQSKTTHSAPAPRKTHCLMMGI